MNRYVVLYQASESVAERFARATPQETRIGMQAWADWSATVGSALVDPGGPLANPVTITSTGPTDSKSTIIGMSILQAESRENALELVRGHHHLQWSDECSITLLEEIGPPELAA